MRLEKGAGSVVFQQSSGSWCVVPRWKHLDVAVVAQTHGVKVLETVRSTLKKVAIGKAVEPKPASKIICFSFGVLKFFL
jgi:hypothetical protein